MTHHLVRRAKASDLPEILDMVHALAAHHGDTAAVTLNDLRRDLMGDHPWVIALVASGDDGLAGYAVLCPLVQMQYGVRGMDMHHLFVQASARGCGLGQALVEGCKSEVQSLGCRYMVVGTHPENAAAGAFYRAAGFDDMPPPGPRFRIRL
ncbi:GNAT family N-acetyltransferase [Sulfitobacter aestuariivivens]|uniref:GNAT family N-acetyltransferase n=1 Tax=Sulfitobacter aestuariivivens TaxID=2766981 RepID=A0A927D5J5_9RHOB|nr:GNAT family N-acetyltransferase [Sulfitobacter aestuariivivens]MBD3664776.1 GNAT family N-acetyltransferase [Sulfitobacter aestuariivivens]